MRVMCALVAVVTAGPWITLAADDDPVFAKGQTVRVNMLLDDDVEGQAMIWATIATAKEHLQKVPQALAKKQRLPKAGAAYIGHGTWATVLETHEIVADEFSFPAARVKLLAGTLRDQEFWILTRSLRHADESDGVPK
jgi:hypothetical protein